MKKTISVNPYLIVGISLVVILLFIKQGCNKVNSDKAAMQLVAALQDTLRHYKNKDSQNVATISVIQTQSASNFLKLQVKDKQIVELQNTVKKYKRDLVAGSSVTQALIETVAELKGKKPEVIYQKGDTVKTDSVTYVYPTYKDSVSNEWIKLYAQMNRDSSRFNLSVTNKFSVIVGYGRKFPSTKKQPYVDLITENPYTTTKQLRTYQVTMPKQKRFGIGLSTGITAQITEDFKIKPAPYVGIGLNFNILRL